MSRYEMVCDLLRQRRAERDRVREARAFWDGEKEFLAVIHDALIELGPLFEADAEECERLMAGENGSWRQRYECRLVQQRPDRWPLQSELDA